MKKRFFSILLSLCMVLMLCPMTVFAEDGTAAELQNLLDNGGTVTLERDYTIDTSLEVNNTVTLDLNGREIRMTGSNRVIRINGGGSLILQDSSTLATGVITGGNINENGGGVAVLDGASFVMNGGTITGCSASVKGGGVYNRGSFVMNGGTITNCTASSYGGNGVCNESPGSSFTMNAGSISGVVNRDGITTMHANGGEITGLYNDAANMSIIKDEGKSGTTFYGEVKNYLSTIKAGIYRGVVTNCKDLSDTKPGTISGGTFEETVTNQKDAVITGGTFMKEVQNNGTITGGTFKGNVLTRESIIVGTISGGMFYGDISGSDISGKTVTFMKDDSRYALEVVSGDNQVVAPIESDAPEGMKRAWYTDEELTDKYEFGTTLPENIILYAGSFEPITYTVTYDPGEGGTGSIAAGTKTYNVPFTLSSDTFTREGYVQCGWSCVNGGALDFELGGTYDIHEDVILYPVWDEIITLEVPFTTTVEQGGNVAPGKTTFDLAVVDANAPEDSYADVTVSGSVTTNGAGDYEGILTFTGPEWQLWYMLSKGAFVQQVDAGEEGWTYDDTVWGLSLEEKEIVPLASTDDAAPAYSVQVYTTKVEDSDNGPYYQINYTDPQDKMRFTNIYTKSTTEPTETTKPTGTTKPTASTPTTNATTSVQTGDNSNLMLWLVLLAVSAAGVIGTDVYSRRRRSSRTK